MDPFVREMPPLSPKRRVKPPLARPAGGNVKNGRGRRIIREPFDHTRTYTAARDCTIATYRYKAGDVFDNRIVTIRKLRQLYDARWLRMEDYDYQKEEVAEAAEAQKVAPVKPDFDTLSLVGLREWLKSQNVVPKPRASKTELVAQAEARWQEMING